MFIWYASDVERIKAFPEHARPSTVSIRSTYNFLPSANETNQVLHRYVQNIDFVLFGGLDMGIASANRANQANEAWINALRRSKMIINLEEVQFQNERLTRGVAWLPISQLLSRGLKRLRLKRVNLSEKNCRQLSKTIPFLRGLENLYFAECNFGDEIHPLVIASLRMAIPKVYLGGSTSAFDNLTSFSDGIQP